jgi:two-component system sensor histidine kinase KdpD
MWRPVQPYLEAAAGVAAITAGLAVLASRLPVANLSLLYLPWVVWLGARRGRGPAAVASALAFVAYDLAVVPPVGSLAVGDLGQLPALIALLVAGLATGQLGAAARTARAEAEARERESRDLYEVATAALRLPEVATALDLVRRRLEALPSVASAAFCATEGDALRTVAGEDLSPDLRRQARWAWRRRTPLGLALDGERLRLLRQAGAAAQVGILPLTAGVAVIRFEPPELAESDLRLLAALLGLGGLLLDRRRAALEAERARALAASDRLKAAVLSSFSHELKSPIASLRAGLTGLLAPGARLGPGQRDLIRTLDLEAAHLDRLVGDVLALARLEAGEPVRAEPVAVAELVGAVLQRLAPELAQTRIEVHVPADLPPALADELQLDRLLGNLLRNAAQWCTPAGAVAVGGCARGDRLLLWVENDGPPIPAEDLQHIFDTFWTRREGGTGLGLAIARRIAEAHGGELEARNLRRGPRFTVSLPMATLVVP